MPVWKYRTLEEAERALWTTSDDPALPRRIRSHWRRSSPPLAGPRGVLKYRTIEDANADREKWESDRIARIRAERLRK